MLMTKATTHDYAALHAELGRKFPRVGVCEECGERKVTEYALRRGRSYSADRADYRELCRPCHRTYDLGSADARIAARQERIIAQIKLWADTYGEHPKVADWRKVASSDYPSYLTVIRAFGSWDEAIRAAGFEPRGRGRKFRG